MVEQAVPLARGGSHAPTGLFEDVGSGPSAPRLPQDRFQVGEGGPAAVSRDARRASSVPADRDREAARPAHLPRRAEGSDRLKTPPPAPRLVPRQLDPGAPPSSRRCTLIERRWTP